MEYVHVGAVFMIIRSSAPSNRSLGAVNGIAQFVTAIMRAIAPATSTSLFASSLEYNWLGGYAVYPICILLSVAVAFSARPLPSSGMWSRSEETTG